MGGHIRKARNLLQQGPGQESRHAIAAGIANIPQTNRRAKRGGLYRITPEEGEPVTIHAMGREAWALDRLHAAGSKGCTPIEEPAPRWSAYVHALRERGVPIVTLREAHGGDFAGHHARYVLRATVQKGGAA
jgi:hypothetical protein